MIQRTDEAEAIQKELAKDRETLTLSGVELRRRIDETGEIKINGDGSAVAKKRESLMDKIRKLLGGT